MRIEATARVTAADARTRTIAGRVVTFGEVGNTSAGPTRFEAGSIAWDGDVVLRLEHDRTRPIGRAIELAEDQAGITGAFRVLPTRTGDDALVEAAEGLRAGFSVGVEVDSYEVDGDVMVITAARLDEVSLVTHPAIASAQVEQVAASEPLDETVEPEDPTTEPVEDNPTDEGATVDESTPVVEATATPAPVITTSPRIQFASAGDFAKTLIAAERGDRDARLRIEAAITPAGTADEPGVVPPSYTRQIIDHVGDIRPLASNVRNVAIPASGMKVIKPTWTVRPAGGWLASENTDAASNKPTITTHEVDIEQWAYAFGASVALVERSDPSFVDAIYSGAVKDYHADVEAKIATELEAITNTVAKGTDHLKSLGKAAAKVYTDVKQAPNKAYIAPDVWGDLVSTTGTLLIANGNGSLSSVSGNILGLDLVVSPALTAGTIIVGVSSAYELRESAQMRLSANLVGTMTIEFGATSFAAFDLEDGKAFVKVTATT